MDNESDTFSVGLPQKILQRIPIDNDDYPYSMMASNNSSSDFAQVTMMKATMTKRDRRWLVKLTLFLKHFQIADSSLFDENFNDSMTYTQMMRHSSTISIIYCIAYFLVFSVGLIGNLFVISVVFRVSLKIFDVSLKKLFWIPRLRYRECELQQIYS